MSINVTLAKLIAAAAPLCKAVMDADATGKRSIKLDDVIEDAVHLGVALDEAEAALRTQDEQARAAHRNAAQQEGQGDGE